MACDIAANKPLTESMPISSKTKRIADVFVGKLNSGDSEPAAHRLMLIETVSVRSESFLHGDQIRIIHWVRKALSSLGGRRRPLVLATE